MRSDLRNDLTLIAALLFAVQPAMARPMASEWVCAASGPVRKPGGPADMPLGCHACTLCPRPDEENEEGE